MVIQDKSLPYVKLGVRLTKVPNTNHQPAEFVLGLHTFWGCYLTYRDQIARDYGWNENTAKTYESSILNKIVKHIRDHDRRPLRTLSIEDYTEALDAIRREGYIGENGTVYAYDSDTLNRFRYLMEVITETGEKNYLCRNVMAVNAQQGKKMCNHDMLGKIVPKYLSPDLELQLGDILLNDPMQDGELMGLAGMYCWGGRNAESAGLNFGDIKLWHDIPGCWVAWVYKTTKIDSSQLQSGGKTRNADRVVLLPDRYITLILERKKQLQAILGPLINIDDLPIACKGNDYANRCSADDLTKAAKNLFTQLRLPPEQIIAAHDDIRNAMAADIDPLDHLGLDLLEKEPTAYFLRRLYGTALACVGLSEQDVAFQIGHDLGTVPEYRNELLNTGRILTIKQKLDNRPVVNSVMYDKTIILPKHGVSAVDACKKQVYVLNPESRRIELHLSAKEPRDQIQVRILSKGSGKVNIQETAYALGNDKYPMALDISVDCHHIYQRRRSK